jgi:hypothetical protein
MSEIRLADLMMRIKLFNLFYVSCAMGKKLPIAFKANLDSFFYSKLGGIGEMVLHISKTNFCHEWEYYDLNDSKRIKSEDLLMVRTQFMF